MSERWLPVEEFPGYEVSSLGRVRSIDRVSLRGDGVSVRRKGRVLKARLSVDGYMQINLRRNGELRTTTVHAIVARAFIGPRPGKQDVAHNDGNGANNAVENLRFDSRRNNNLDKRVHGTMPRGERHWSAKLNNDAALEIRASSESNAALARRYGVSVSTVYQARVGTTWKHLREDIQAMDAARAALREHLEGKP